MSGRVKLKDVASAAGVSVTAASLVLNNKPTRMSKSKRKLIIESAKELKYVPNQNARSLVTNTSMLLALLVPDIENIFFASLAKQIEDFCRSSGYSLIVANSDDEEKIEHELLVQLDARDIDGLFLIPSQESVMNDAALKEDVARMSCPVILTDRLLGVEWCDSVGSNNYAGGKQAAEVLLAHGHTRIACISGDRKSDASEARKTGFLDGLAKAGYPIAPELDINGDYRFRSGYEATDEIIAEGATAVFCCNDMMALGFINRLNELNMKVPDDCSLIGYDNTLSRLGMGQKLTTFDQGIFKMAQTCSKQMLNRIEELHGNDKAKLWLEAPTTQVLEPTIVQRGSVRDV